MTLDWTHRVFAGEERDALILDLLQRIDRDRFSRPSKNAGRWEVGWRENLEAFEASGDVVALKPRYFHPNMPMRFNGEFVQFNDPDFEWHWYENFRAELSVELEPFDHIYEFGCGSGHNVAYWAGRWPRKQVIGLDRTPASLDIMASLNRRLFPNVSGYKFDFHYPETDLIIEPNSAIVTVGALEQTGLGWWPFMDFVLKKKPALCIHIEPIMEWYDTTKLVDWTAWKIHDRRGFWQGFPPRLKELEDLGRVKIHRTKRTGLGSLLLEGYSQIVWSPL